MGDALGVGSEGAEVGERGDRVKVDGEVTGCEWRARERRCIDDNRCCCLQLVANSLPSGLN